jgi:hypothetical protein
VVTAVNLQHISEENQRVLANSNYAK